MIDSKAKAKLFKDNKNVIGEDAYNSWCKIQIELSKSGEVSNAEKAQIMEYYGLSYKHWEFTRWERKTRSVPKNAQAFFVAYIMYFWLFKQKPRKNSQWFTKILSMTSNRIEGRDGK